MSTISLSGSPDYGSLQAWEDDAPATLVSIWSGEVQEPDDNFSSSSALLTVSGSTSTASLYKELTSASGASFRDNAGAATNALKYNESNGMSATSSVSFNAVLNLAENYCRMSNIQVKATSTANAVNCNNIGIRLNNIIAQTDAGLVAVRLANNDVDLANSLLVQRKSAANAIVFAFGSANLYNVTCVVPSDITGATNGMDQSFFSGDISSCIFMGCTNTADAAGGTYTTCFTSDTTPPTGCTNVTYADQFENTADATMDFRLKSGADAIDGGTYDATNAPNDIIGTARGSGTADAGCWEFVSAGGGGRIMGSLAYSGGLAGQGGIAGHGGGLAG